MWRNPRTAYSSGKSIHHAAHTPFLCGRFREYRSNPPPWHSPTTTVDTSSYCSSPCIADHSVCKSYSCHTYPCLDNSPPSRSPRSWAIGRILSCIGSPRHKPVSVYCTPGLVHRKPGDKLRLRHKATRPCAFPYIDVHLGALKEMIGKLNEFLTSLKSQPSVESKQSSSPPLLSSRTGLRATTAARASPTSKAVIITHRELIIVMIHLVNCRPSTSEPIIYIAAAGKQHTHPHRRVN